MGLALLHHLERGDGDGIALGGRLAEPGGGLVHVGGAGFAVKIHFAQVLLGRDVAGIGQPGVLLQGFWISLLGEQGVRIGQLVGTDGTGRQQCDA